MENIITLTGKEPGPVITIMGGIHGDEVCGVHVIDIIKNWEIKRGILHLIYGNPKAIEQNVRCVETNLNRLFLPENKISNNDKNTYEYQRSREILPFLHQSQALLDIHASFTPESFPFI